MWRKSGGAGYLLPQPEVARPEALPDELVPKRVGGHEGHVRHRMAELYDPPCRFMLK